MPVLWTMLSLDKQDELVRAYTMLLSLRENIGQMTDYSVQDYTDVESDNGVRVVQTATSEYTIHQFKDYIVANGAVFKWDGQTNCPPSLSTVFLQIYNRNSTTWETLDSDNTTAENTDFILTGTKSDLTNYKDGSGVVSCRVYQLDV